MDSAAVAHASAHVTVPAASPEAAMVGDTPMPGVEDVLREHGAMLARIAGSYERDPARCEDLLQEISLALWRALPRWRGEATLRTFVARVAHNRAIDALSRQPRREDELDEHHHDPGADPLQHAEVQQRRRSLMDAVRRLPLGQRQVVVLALEGFALREIGDALALEENTVAQRLSRARRQLRDWLGEAA